MKKPQYSSDMLTALNEAVLAIAEGLSLPLTLQRIADTARTLAQSRYAALGVLSDDSLQLKQFITSGIEPQIARRIHHEPRGTGLLGSVLEEDSPINVSHIQDDPRSAGFCENHPTMTSFLGVPITNRGKRIGNLYLSDRIDGQPFDKQDEEILTLLAAHVAIAIENAQLHQTLQDTALRSERDRIGMELHDGVIQSIYAVGMKLEILRSKFDPEGEQQTQFYAVMDDLNQIIDDIRAYIQNLLTAQDERVTLKTFVDNIARHFRDFSGVPVVFDIGEDVPNLSDYQRHNLLQILREALANVARHANASEASVSIRKVERDLMLTVGDNGQGFDAEVALEKVSGHFGLFNIEQRIKRMGGTFDMNSTLNEGTTLTIRVPIKPA